MNDEGEVVIWLKNCWKELQGIRKLCSEAVAQMRDAEQEIPEFMRRFMNYMHDLHDIRYMFEELGHVAPRHLLDEMERCDDRLRQLLTKLHTDGGAFEKVRREMAEDPKNRWDHTRLLEVLSDLKEKQDETRKSE